MEQRYLCFAVFEQRMLKQSLDGVDRDLLRKAVRAGLQNEDGRARGSIGSVYQQLSYDEIKPLLPAIREAVVKPAPSGIMFADGIRLEGLALLAKHHIREGMPLCLDVMEIHKWGKKSRIDQAVSIHSPPTAARPNPYCPGSASSRRTSRPTARRRCSSPKSKSSAPSSPTSRTRRKASNSSSL